MIEKLIRGVKFIGIMVACFIGIIILAIACEIVALKIIMPIAHKLGG